MNNIKKPWKNRKSKWKLNQTMENKGPKKKCEAIFHNIKEELKNKLYYTFLGFSYTMCVCVHKIQAGKNLFCHSVHSIFFPIKKRIYTHKINRKQRGKMVSS